MERNEPASPFRERDRIRDLVVRDFLVGRGLEIGAGVTPQRLPPGATCRLYDLRTTAELTTLFGQTPANEAAGLDRIAVDFPDGADFLVAHNVLEHAPDPIGTLIQWHRFVRQDGVVALSFPDKSACPDATRLEPPFSHLLDDHLLGRDGHSFESREHALSFCLSWPRPEPAKVTGRTVGLLMRKLARVLGGRGQDEPGQIGSASQILADQLEPGIDIHWHAYTQSLAEKTIQAACTLDGRSARLQARADLTSSPIRTLGDIIFVYHLAAGGENHGFHHHVEQDLSAARHVMAAALSKLDAASVAAATIPADARTASAVYPAWIERTDRPAEFDLEGPFAKEIGVCFTRPGLITRDEGDSPEHPQRSRFELLENGVPLGPSHAAHRLIREQGRGHYSHWQNCLFFSTSDNSDPNRNGRSYRLRLRDT